MTSSDMRANVTSFSLPCTHKRTLCVPAAGISTSRTGSGVRLSAGFQQELSYRKQIARQLRTQYAKGIYRPKYYTVTLKSRLRVTQGHSKRNHWIDHTRLTISRVIVDVEYYRDLEM